MHYNWLSFTNRDKSNKYMVNVKKKKKKKEFDALQEIYERHTLNEYENFITWNQQRSVSQQNQEANVEYYGIHL